jgi:hypothetical protein
MDGKKGQQTSGPLSHDLNEYQGEAIAMWKVNEW